MPSIQDVPRDPSPLSNEISHELPRPSLPSADHERIDDLTNPPLPEKSKDLTDPFLPEKSKDLIVYSRRPKAQNEVRDQDSSKQCQEANPICQSSSKSTGNALQNSNFPMFNDLDQPIALRKEKRSCTQHPINNFVSYDKLSPSYKAFATTLTDINVPKGIHDALTQPKWREAVMEEVNALKKK